MTDCFYQGEIDPNAIRNKRVAVVGYGSQGRGQALNLRDSGVDVLVGLRPNGKSWALAEEDGFVPQTIDEASKRADVVCMLCPDMAQPKVYRDLIEPNLAAGSTLLFAHGFNVHYGSIQVAPSFNAVLVAPKGPGTKLRSEYLNGFGLACLFAVAQDASGDALKIALAYADAIGGTRVGLIETSFAEETETDLFSEQAILCGGLTELIVAGFETLVDAGYRPEVAYFECLHEVKLIVDLLHDGGFRHMHDVISDTAKYGDVSRGSRVINAETRARMREILQEVKDGTFARQWIEEYDSGEKNFRAMVQMDLDHQIESVGQRIRDRFQREPIHRES